MRSGTTVVLSGKECAGIAERSEGASSPEALMVATKSTVFISARTV